MSQTSTELQKPVQRTSKKVEGPHLKQQDYEREVLTLLSEMTEPMPARAIIQELERRVKNRFSEADLQATEGTKGKSNLPRWEATARFAIYQGLKKKGLITAMSKNQWVIAPKEETSSHRSVQAETSIAKPRPSQFPETDRTPTR